MSKCDGVAYIHLFRGITTRVESPKQAILGQTKLIFQLLFLVLHRVGGVGGGPLVLVVVVVVVVVGNTSCRSFQRQ